MFWFIYHLPLHVVIFASFLAPALWALFTGLASRFPKAVRVINILAFAVSLGGILCFTLFRSQSGERELILTPLHSFIEARQQKEMYRSMLMNVALFVPMGISLPYVLSSKKSVIKTVLTALVLSVIIEALQLAFGLGRCETDDVLCNTLGAAVGGISFILSEKLTECRTSKRKTE